MPTPYNDALTRILKGLETHRAQVVRGEPIDYDRLEAQAASRHA